MVFRPTSACANIVVDGTPDSISSSKRPDHLELQGAITAAYLWTTKDGALCEEAMRGVRFKLSDARLHSGCTWRGSGHIIGTARRCFLAAQLGASAGLQEPIVHCEVVCPNKCVKDATCSIFAKRSGVLISETPVDNSQIFRLMYEIPAAETLDLDHALADVGCKHPAQSIFSHWSSLPGDPQSPGRHRDIVVGLRRWKHLEPEVPTLETIFGSVAALTLPDVFSDDLADLIVPSL